jgi:hypothetical protein
MGWLRLIRFLTQYVAPGLAAVAVLVEIVGWLLAAPLSPSVTHTYHYLLLIVFSLLTVIMIGICGWIVCLWDLDRLFFKLESKIDSQIAALKSKSRDSGNDGTLLGRARELLNKVMKAAEPWRSARSKSLTGSTSMQAAHWHFPNRTSQRWWIRSTKAVVICLRPSPKS